MGDPPRDDELLAALATGSEAAFDVVFERWRARLFSFLARLTGRCDLAEDLVSETFLRLVGHAGRLGPGSHLGAWLFKVARNLYVDWLRSRALDDARTAEFAALESVRAGAEGPFEELAAQETTRALESSLASLPRPWREVLLLVGVEGLTPQDAAAVCGITPEAARKRLQRARDALAAALAAAGTEVRR